MRTIIAIRRSSIRVVSDHNALQNPPRVQDAPVVGPAEARAVGHESLGRSFGEVGSEFVHHYLRLQIPDLSR